MTYQRQVLAQLKRVGKRAAVLTASDDGQDEFGNPSQSYSEDRTVTAVRTYPNRNTEVMNQKGELHRDNPLFIFAKGTDEDPPGANDRLRYPKNGGELYEMKSPTHYDTHVEMFGTVVLS